MELYNLIANAKPSRSNSTIKSYVHVLVKHFGPQYVNLQSFEFVVDYLETIDKLTTKKNVLTAIIVYINAMARLYPTKQIYTILSK